jgi:predicted PurR-regulated permease PerM
MHMLGLDARVARATWTVVAVMLALGLAYLARKTLFIFVLALFFAYMLRPVVEFIDRKLTNRRLPKDAVLVLAYVVFIGAMTGIGFLIGSVISEQAASLTENLPRLIQQRDPLQSVWLPSWLEPVRPRIGEILREQVSHLNSSAFPLIQRAVREVVSHASILLFIVLVPILAFFFLKDGPKIRDTAVVWVASERRNRVVLDEILADVHILLGSYIRALVILAIVAFICYSIVLSILGVAYAALLGLIAAMLEAIPVIGPLAAALIILLVAAVTGSDHLLLIVIFIALYRMFQDYVLSPYLLASGVELHPLLVLFGVLAGEQIAGIPGMFLSVPVIATLRVIYVRVHRGSRQHELAPETVP